MRFEAAAVWRTPLSADHTILFETFTLGFSKGNPVLTASSQYLGLLALGGIMRVVGSQTLPWEPRAGFEKVQQVQRQPTQAPQRAAQQARRLKLWSEPVGLPPRVLRARVLKVVHEAWVCLRSTWRHAEPGTPTKCGP